MPALVLALALAATSPVCLRADAQETKEKVPAKQDVTFAADDDVVLKATFWPGTRGKESVPVMLLHGYGGNRQDFNAPSVVVPAREESDHGPDHLSLPELLQRRGCAVIAPDLRGHGDSTQVRDSNRSLRASEMSPAAFADMEEDIEAAKRFLMAKNNAGELNIDKLCIVGADMGALVAANWAITDWNWPPLAVGKQGQDVKALVLLSPPEKFKSLRMIEPLGDPMVRTQLAVLIVVGNEDPAAVRDANKIYAGFRRHHPDPVKEEDRDLFIDRDIPTRLQGTKLLGKEFGKYRLPELIAEFIDLRVDHQPVVWQDRKLP
jgi:pimeloyl-ACP methyl ester carboxylesterase